MTGSPPRLKAAAVTDKGAVRSQNQDAYVARPEAGLWAVADGMGGLQRGEWASAEVTGALADVRLTGAFDADVEFIAGAVYAASAKIFAEATVSGQQIGSTVVALVVNGSRFAVLWAGDSRAYLLRRGELFRLSRDHRIVQERVDAGLITEAEARGHPLSNVISRAAGVEAVLEIDVVADETETGDMFMLCSDGLHETVDDAEIAERLGGKHPQVACDQLLELSLSRGAPDNVTVVAVSVEEITQVLAPTAPVTSP
jgi:serine/threonine protein phosphatase PrpC